MHFTHDMAEAFGDWLELERIRRALLAARPEFDDALVLDVERPLLRIQRPRRSPLLVARAAEDIAGRWIIGIPSTPAPILREASSCEGVVDIVLGAVE